ncbi:MAG TPA: 2-hydroxyacyl-CoA dehydratase family protein, partial [Candidatus Hodarchaeales archaeon]|nr:2-hydroxyacyl-CoA dehydratase family protein [Candidatus Hodarchaeales archaeon]
MKKIMRDYYLDLDRASKAPDEYVAWCTSAGPAELLRSMGFKVYFPENHSAILGSSRTAGEFIPIGNSAGYSPDICTYLTADIGAFLQETTPLTKMYGISTVPKPDVLVYSTNQCRDTQEWFRFYSEYLKVPFIGVNPPHNLPKVSPYDLENVSAQFQNMIPTLEKITGHDFEVSRLKKTLQNSLEATQLWKKVLNLGQHIPSPLTFFDSCIHMGPIVVLRGEEIAIEYYRKLYDELRLRVKEGFGAVEDEK